MILRDLADYLKAERRQSLCQLAKHFHCDEAALLPLLEFWMARGRIRREVNAPCRAGCCEQEESVSYLWVDEGEIPIRQKN